MKFRYARHTDDIQSIIDFYTKVIGLKVLGSFEKHSDYNGVFLGLPDLDWHLEFTESKDKAEHHPDKDDLIVFYLNSDEELAAIINDAQAFGFEPVQSKNPYWQLNGVELKDPDNFGIILTIHPRELKSEDPLTSLLHEKGILNWEQFLHSVRSIPYGRIAEKNNLKLVITENQGTCSSKHALIKEIASLNQIEGVELILAIYKMTEANTQGIGSHIAESGLSHIPEAHCYVKINGKRIDLTNVDSDILKLEKDILLEMEIEPHQIGQFKVDYHKAYIENWRKLFGADRSLDQIWALREKCIEELSKN